MATSAGVPEGAAAVGHILQWHWSGGPHLSQIHLGSGLEKGLDLTVDQVEKKRCVG